jgi:hypothetical protein
MRQSILVGLLHSNKSILNKFIIFLQMGESLCFHNIWQMKFAKRAEIMMSMVTFFLEKKMHTWI